MAGFKNLREYADAEDMGQFHVVGFRKRFGPTISGSNRWFDYSYFPGAPAANFYASSPLEAAVVDATRGIPVPSVAPATQWLRNIKLMAASTSVTDTGNGRQQIVLNDLLLYYPFIDTDAVGEQQDLVNAVTIPRYDHGMVMAVGQSLGATVGQFTFSYTNQDGVTGRTSQNHFTFVTQNGGQIVAASVGNSGSFHPFLSLQAGDYGVKSIESVTFTAGGGGLMALVIVHPLLTAYVTQECRRTTSGNLESYGSCSEFASIINNRPQQIKDGAVLGLLSAGHAGNLGNTDMVGILETTWN